MPANKIYDTIRSRVLQKLSDQLPQDLLYHSIHHTIDVEKQAERIALSENISHPTDLLLLKIACLYHDSGFIFTYHHHEVAGCELAKEELPSFGFINEEIDIICELIMATRIPQSPLSPLGEIICDADLDYLGREDFFTISNSLFLELKARDMVETKDDWDLIQVNFFKQHDYFTETNKKLRGHHKQRHLQIIESSM